MPAQLAYASDNRLLDDQWYWATSLLDAGKPVAASDRAAALELLTPQAEDYQRVSPDYPLLKATAGFHGPKQFELRVAPGERPHVVLLFLESFRAADVGALGGKHGASPCFDRLAREGVLFTNFYSNGVQTSRAVIAGLFGILPCLTEKSVQVANVDLPLIGVADLFNARGYRSAYFSGVSRRFESQGEFFAQHGYAEIHAEEQILAAHPQARRSSWGYHDEYVLDTALRWLVERDRQGQPGLATVFTISHHYPWETPAGHAAPRFDTGANAEYARFLSTFHYSDACLGRFVERLRETGLDRRTVLFVLGDHGAAQGEHHGNFMNVNYLYEETLRIPLLVLAAGRLQRPAVIHDPGSQVDLLPTLMDLFGLTGLNHAVGTSLVRRVENRVVYLNNPFGMQYAGLRSGDHKFMLALRPDVPYLFDLACDPGERHNLAGEHPAECRQHAADVRHVNRFFLNLYLQRRFSDPKLAP
jgi:lipoteichoic acid synthase